MPPEAEPQAEANAPSMPHEPIHEPIQPKSRYAQAIKNIEPYKWVQGQSGNPLGRTPIRAELDKIRGISRSETLLAISRTMLYTRDQMKSIAVDPKATMVELLVGSVMKKAIDFGCPQRAAFLISYILGKPETTSPEREVSEVELQAKAALDALPTSMLIEMVKATPK